MVVCACQHRRASWSVCSRDSEQGVIVYNNMVVSAAVGQKRMATAAKVHRAHSLQQQWQESDPKRQRENQVPPLK
jgi:hypothetical protein